MTGSPVSRSVTVPVMVAERAPAGSATSASNHMRFSQLFMPLLYKVSGDRRFRRVRSWIRTLPAHGPGNDRSETMKILFSLNSIHHMNTERCPLLE